MSQLPRLNKDSKAERRWESSSLEERKASHELWMDTRKSETDELKKHGPFCVTGLGNIFDFLWMSLRLIQENFLSVLCRLLHWLPLVFVFLDWLLGHCWVFSHVLTLSIQPLTGAASASSSGARSYCTGHPLFCFVLLFPLSSFILYRIIFILRIL